MGRRCDTCSNEAPVLFASPGRLRIHYECARCFGVDEPPPAGPELITDTFAAGRTARHHPTNSCEARLLAIVDKLTGVHA